MSGLSNVDRVFRQELACSRPVKAVPHNVPNQDQTQAKCVSRLLEAREDA